MSLRVFMTLIHKIEHKIILKFTWQTVCLRNKGIETRIAREKIKGIKN